MEQSLFLTLYLTGILFFILSTMIDGMDISNTYQVEMSFLSIVIWVSVLYSSFNIEYLNGSFAVNRIYDFGYIIVALMFFLMSFINTFVLLTYGTYNSMLKVVMPKLKGT